MSRGPEPMVSDERLLELVDNCEEVVGRPVITATEIANRVDIARQNVHRRLEQLRDDGRVRKHKPGQSAIWWSESDDRRQN